MSNTIQPKGGLQLRKIGNKYMIVEADTESSRTANVFSLNHTAADMWHEINAARHTPEQLAIWLAKKYGIAANRAAADVRHQLEAWRDFGLIIF